VGIPRQTFNFFVAVWDGKWAPGGLMAFRITLI